MCVKHTTTMMKPAYMVWGHHDIKCGNSSGAVEDDAHDDDDRCGCGLL